MNPRHASRDLYFGSRIPLRQPRPHTEITVHLAGLVVPGGGVGIRRAEGRLGRLLGEGYEEGEGGEGGEGEGKGVGGEGEGGEGEGGDGERGEGEGGYTEGGEGE